MFMSVVNRSSKPAASAAAISSPFYKTVPSAFDGFHDDMTFQGMSQLSKRMSINVRGSGRYGRGRVKAAGRELDHGNDLFTR